MPSYTQRPLATLRDRRLDEERQFERALAEAVARQRRAEDEAARLEIRVGEARAALERSRGTPPGAESAAAAQTRRRFWARREGELRAASAALASHRDGALAEALRAVEAARAACARGRQRREVVDKAIARRAAAGRREAERRAEAEVDDRARPRPNPRPK
jgi:type II secretory pathway component PulJ